MKYNQFDIGNRILECREATLVRKKNGNMGKMTQADLGDILLNDADRGMNRKTISNYEHGEQMPTLDTLLKMCEVFDCELGFLLCEPGYELGSRMETDINKETGLSKQSIEYLHSIATKEQSQTNKVVDCDIDFINDMLSVMPQILAYIKLYRGKKVLMEETFDAPIVPEERKDFSRRLWKYSIQEVLMQVVDNYLMDYEESVADAIEEDIKLKISLTDAGKKTVDPLEIVEALQNKGIID